MDRPLGSELLQDGLEARVSITASKLGYCLINTCILEAARITFKSLLEESLIIDCSYFIRMLCNKYKLENVPILYKVEFKCRILSSRSSSC